MMAWQPCITIRKHWRSYVISVYIFMFAAVTKLHYTPYLPTVKYYRAVQTLSKARRIQSMDTAAKTSFITTILM
jgi:hypothetical protein